MKYVAVCFSLLCSASAANFTLDASPRSFTIQKGSSTQVTVSQTTAGFSGLVSYQIFSISSGLSATLATVANTATLTISASETAISGNYYVFLEGSNNGSAVFLLLSATVVAPVPVPVITPQTGAITLSSIAAQQSQTFNFTTLGTADWFAMGAYGPACSGGPCVNARKTGGTGLVGAYSAGGVDPGFYTYIPNFANVTWSDSTVIPNGSAAHVNNSSISFEAFAGTETRTLTVIAGSNGGGMITTTLHLTDNSAPDVVDRQTFSGSGVRAYTINFNAASAGHQLMVTMTRSGGELLIYGAALAGSPKPEVHNLTLTEDLQGFLQTVMPGDTLVLPDGYSRIGHLILPARLASGYVDIKSNTTVAPGTRVKPGDLKAVLISPDESPAIQNDMSNPDHSQRSARGWRFTGVEITANNTRGGINYTLISLGFGSNPIITDIPRDIVFDRCYIHGDGVSNYIRGVVGNANNITISSSYLSGFVSGNYEANAINIYSSAGPISIVNNYLEATGENIMIGGAGPDIGPVLVPTNGLIQHNYFYKQPSWRGGPFIVKNLLEFKDGYNFTIDSNVFENCWQASQSGYALLITPRIGQGGSTANHVDTLTYSNNIIAHVANGITIGLYDDLALDSNGKTIAPSQLQLVHDITLRNNLFDDLGLQYGAGYSHGMLIFGPPNNLVFDHNTFNFDEQTNDHGWFLAGSTGEMPSNISTTYNDFGADLYGDTRGPADANFVGGVFSHNNIRYPSAKWFSSPYAANNTFVNPAPAGVGADIAGLQARASAVKNGNR